MKIPVDAERLLALKAQLQMMLAELEAQLAGLAQGRVSKKAERMKRYENEFLKNRARSIERERRKEDEP